MCDLVMFVEAMVGVCWVFSSVGEGKWEFGQEVISIECCQTATISWRHGNNGATLI